MSQPTERLALAACRKLLAAYNVDSSDSIDWSDLDDACEAASKAIQHAEDLTPEGVKLRYMPATVEEEEPS